jgi:hypothetical protein
MLPVGEGGVMIGCEDRWVVAEDRWAVPDAAAFSAPDPAPVRATCPAHDTVARGDDEYAARAALRDNCLEAATARPVW